MSKHLVFHFTASIGFPSAVKRFAVSVLSEEIEGMSEDEKVTYLEDMAYQYFMESDGVSVSLDD